MRKTSLDVHECHIRSTGHSLVQLYSTSFSSNYNHTLFILMATDTRYQLAYCKSTSMNSTVRFCHLFALKLVQLVEDDSIRKGHIYRADSSCDIDAWEQKAFASHCSFRMQLTGWRGRNATFAKEGQTIVSIQIVFKVWSRGVYEPNHFDLEITLYA